MKKKLMKVFHKLKDNKGIGTVEVILLLLVLVALVVLFKKQIMSIANTVFNHISQSVDQLY